MHSRAALAVGAGALAAMATLALSVGRYPAGITDLFGGTDPNATAVLLQIRAPRVGAALLVGAALAAAGAVYQAILRNPLVSPDILGVSSGAALGAVLAMLAGVGAALVQASAFAGGVLAVALVYAIAGRLRRHDPLLALVLTGVVLGTLLASLVSLLKLLADPAGQLPAITFWLLGSLTLATPFELALAAALLVAGLAPLVALRWRLDLLTLPDEEARALGVEPARLRALVIGAATLITAVSVALGGIIGWIGLLVPHAARLMVGPSFARLLPLSMLLGAAFLVGVDTLCRVVTQIELPPGVVTALLGTPFFLWLFAAARRSW
jgi:iron complex transport system permease protein